jgi:glycosyltransferase involved in cell wall biosynthesis
LIRVGFQPIGGAGWLGGRNYLWNLLYGLSLVPERRVQPVLMSAPGDAGELLLPGVVHVPRSGPLASVWARRAGTASMRLLGRDLVQDHWMRHARVDVFSHGPPLGKRAGVPFIFWIPDVQHRRFPAFFNAFDRRERNIAFGIGLDSAAAVITSSAAARADLIRYYGARAERVQVLHFVSSPRVDLAKLPSLQVLTARFSLPPRYFHLPNQFWMHKNHALVVDALAELKTRAPEVTVIATGAKEDPRAPRHYDALMAKVARLGLGDRFRHLGLVSYDELIALMRHSVALLNPSLFEGWSSSVEEAKSLGKRVLASDIDVHREQAPGRGQFFPVDDPAALAARLVEAWQSHDDAAEAEAVAAAARALPGRVRAFGSGYEDIVVAALRATPAGRAR